MDILVISGSLNPESHSRVMTQDAVRLLEASGHKARWIDLQDYPLPLCDGDKSYNDPNVGKLAEMIRSAGVILIGVPIYNFYVNAAIKNLVEMTGKAWSNKAVGFLCAAGGRASYMSVMDFANELMLDFRCVIIPRFVYAVDSDFETQTDGTIRIANATILERIEELTEEAISFLGFINTRDQ